MHCRSFTISAPKAVVGTWGCHHSTHLSASFSSTTLCFWESTFFFQLFSFRWDPWEWCIFNYFLPTFTMKYENQSNVGKYTLHGSYGFDLQDAIGLNKKKTIHPHVGSIRIQSDSKKTFSGWWFQIFFYFHPEPWGRFQFWLIFFKGVWNHQLVLVARVFLWKTFECVFMSACVSFNFDDLIKFDRGGS